jgi:hypothetical protein
LFVLASLLFVIATPVAAIHAEVFRRHRAGVAFTAWMAGSSPAMTGRGLI